MVNGKILCNYNGPVPRLLPRGPKDNKPYKNINIDDLEKELDES
jgi:hypothetical protein